MTDPISQNLDYVFFCYGLSYILIAAASYPLQRLKIQGLPWWLLGAFSLLLGTVAWMNLVALAVGDTSFFFHSRLLMMIGADVLLLEFGRRTLMALGMRRIPGWITAVLVVFAVASLAIGEDAAKIIPRYLLAFPGGLLSAWGLWKFSQRVEDGKTEIRLAALAMVLFGIAAGLITAAADFFPATILNQENLHQLTGLSAAFLRSAIALLLAYTLSRFISKVSTKGSFYGESFRVSSGHTRMVLLLIPVLILGWYGSVVTGSHTISNNVTSFRSRAEFMGTSVRLSLDSLLRADTVPPEAIPPALNRALKINRHNLYREYSAVMLLRSPGQPDSILATDTSFYQIRIPSALTSIIRHDIASSEHFHVDTTVSYLPKEKAYATHVIIAENFPTNGSALELLLIDNARDEQQAIFRQRLVPISITFLISLSIILLTVAAHRIRQSIAENTLTVNRYRLLFDHSLASNYVSSPDGRILLCNEAFRKLLGITDSECGEIRAEDLYVDPTMRRDFLERLTENTSLGQYAAQFRRADGRILHVMESATGTFDRHGKLVQIQGSIVDLTERREAEEAVLQREQLLRGIAAASQILITSSETETSVPVALAAIGRAAQIDRIYLFENVQESHSDTWRMDERYQWTQDAPFTAQQRHPLDHRRYADGYQRWYSLLSSGEMIHGAVSDLPAPEKQRLAEAGIRSLFVCPIRFDSKFWGFIGFEDCHSARIWSNNDRAALSSAGLIIASAIERQRIEESLRIKDSAVESSISAIGLADLNGTIIYVNDAYCRLWGFTDKSEVIGQTISAFAQTPGDVTKVITALNEDGQYMGDTEAVRRDGSSFHVHISANMVRSDRGKPLCLMASFLDISERQRSEDLLRNIAQHISAKTGPEYFNSVVEFVARELGVAYALIAEFEDSGRRARTLAVHAYGTSRPNIDYDLAGSPGEIAVSNRPYFCSSDVTFLFPDDHLLDELQANSYAGIPLVSSANIPLGLLSVAGISSEVLDEQRTMALLQIFASRVSAELERTHAEKALRESEERYRLMSDNMSDVVWLMDATTYLYKYVSPSVERLRGFSTEDVMRQSFAQMMTPESCALVTELLPRALREFVNGDESWRHHTLQIDQLHRDGSVIHTEIVTTFLTDDSGKVREILGVTRDITERKHAEEAIRESEERFRSVFKEGPLGMVIVTPDLRFSLANAAFCKMIGLTEDELMGRQFTEITHPENAEADASAVINIISGDLSAYSTMKRYIRKDGETVWAQTKVTGIHDSSGRVCYLLAMVEDISDRIQAEQALSQSESRLRMVTENMTNLVALIDAQANYRYVSPSYQANLGYDPDELLGKPSGSLIHPEDLAHFVPSFTDALVRKDAFYRNEVRLRHADGQYLWHEINITILYDADKVLAGGVIAALNINDRKLAAEALAQREQQLQSLFGNMLEAVALHELVVDSNGTPIDYRILDMNPQFENVLGLRRLNIIGRLATEVYQTDSAPYLEEYSNVLLTGIPIHMETYFAPMDKHFSISVAPWGKSGFATIFTDISERKRSESQIRALNQSLESRIIALTQPLGDTSSLRLEDIFDLSEIQKIQDAFAAATGVASIITDTQGNPITRPSNFCHLCEHIIRKTEAGLANCYHSDAIIGRKHEGGPVMQHCLSGGLWDGGTSICVGDHHIANWLIGQVLEEPLNEEAMVDYAHQIGADETAFRAALKDVTRMPREQFSDVCQALYIIANQLSNLAVQNVQQARFITERKQAEADRIRLEEQLRQALKLESIGHLAGGIAHDFNNMLTPIVGYAEMLQFQLSKDHPYQETLQQIIRAALRARDLTRQLLAFARKQTLAMKVLDLNGVVLNFEKMLRRTLRENVSFEISLAHGLRPFMGDEGQIEQIILNLSVNAQDAMPDGGKLVLETSEVELDSSSGDGVEEVRPGLYVMLSVSDTGTGMDKDTLSKIFDPFYTTKGLGRGTGLGLSTVYGIVRQHGGHVRVYSEPGYGTTFRIYFPQSGNAIETVQTAEIAAPPVRGKETILLVEDEEQVRAVALEILQQYGYTVIEAMDGDVALEIAATMDGEIDLLVTDIIMPTMNGRQLFERLVVTRPELKALYMSGYSEDVIAHHGVLEAGVNFIQKPFSLHAFASRVRQVLDQTPAT